MQFNILGAIEGAVEGRPVHVGPPKRRLLLGLLLLECGRPIAMDQLVQLMWDNPPPSARQVVFSHVSRLRKALATHGVELAGARGGYLLRVDPDRVDIHAFRRRVAEAKAAADAPARSDALREALTLWRGPALENLALGSGAERLSRSLEELRLSVIEDRVDADLAAGRHGVVVAELAELVAAHPLRERLAGQYILALYRAGDAGRALIAYQQIRTVLGDDLGLDPGPQLTALHHAILRRDPALAAPASEIPATAETPAQLPPMPSPFVGRSREMDLLNGALTRAGPAPVVTVSGSAGVGKTALAVHWAHGIADRFPDGQLYVNLREFDPGGPTAASTEPLRELLDAFGVEPARVPATAGARAGLYRKLVAGRRMLVLLDNAVSAEQVRPLLPGSAGCLALVTGRYQLTGLVAEGAQPIVLDVLSPLDARELFTARLGARRASAEPAAVTKIVSLCGDLPFALCLIAARAAINPRFPLAAFAAELRDERSRLDAFDGGDPSTGLRSVFSSSYERLGPQAARVFRLIGLHPCPDISAATVARLARRSVAEIQPALRELTHAHLLLEHLPGRYTFHLLLRAYALEQARLHGDTNQMTDMICAAA